MEQSSISQAQASDTTQRMGSVLSNSKRLQSLLREPTPEEQAATDRWHKEREDCERAQKISDCLRRFFGSRENRYCRCTLDNFEASDERRAAAIQALAEYVETLPERVHEGNGIILYGPCGTGKDHLAAAVCREAMMQHQMTCQRVNGADWYGDLRDQMDADSARSERRMIDELSHPTILVVSDPLPPVGALSQFQATMFYRLIESRYWQRRPTILTINVKDGAEAIERMGMATWDRVKENAWVIACNWPSYRKPARIVNGGK